MKTVSMIQQPNNYLKYYEPQREEKKKNNTKKANKNMLNRPPKKPLKRSNNRKTLAESPLNPARQERERKERERSRQTNISNSDEEIPEYLRNLPEDALKQALVALRGKGRTRRHRGTRRR